MAMTQMMKKLYRISRERSVFPHMSSFMHTSPDSCPAAIISHLLYHAPGLLQITEKSCPLQAAPPVSVKQHYCARTWGSQRLMAGTKVMSSRVMIMHR